MGRDMEKKNAADYRWTKENCKMFSVKIRYDSGIIDALEAASADLNVSKNGYIVESIREKLQREGYMNKQDNPEE